MDKITAPCRTDYKAYRSSGTRPIESIIWILLHSTEVAATAAQIAKSFSRRTAEGSAHLTVDDNYCYRSLRNDQIPWAAPGANTKGFHIEQCGFASWSKASWMQHENMLDRAAYKVALHCHYFNIPPRFITAAGLKAGHKGISTHAEVSKAFPNSQGNHHDPGTGWPRDYFMALVKSHYDALADE